MACSVWSHVLVSGHIEDLLLIQFYFKLNPKKLFYNVCQSKMVVFGILACDSAFEEAKEGNNKGNKNSNKHEMEQCSTQNIQRKTIKESKHIYQVC